MYIYMCIEYNGAHIYIYKLTFSMCIYSMTTNTYYHVQYTAAHLEYFGFTKSKKCLKHTPKLCYFAYVLYESM